MEALTGRDSVYFRSGTAPGLNCIDERLCQGSHSNPCCHTVTPLQGFRCSLVVNPRHSAWAVESCPVGAAVKNTDLKHRSIHDRPKQCNSNKRKRGTSNDGRGVHRFAWQIGDASLSHRRSASTLRVCRVSTLGLVGGEGSVARFGGKGSVARVRWAQKKTHAARWLRVNRF